VGLAWKAPEVSECTSALQDLWNVLKPHRNMGRGYKDLEAGLDSWTREWLKSMATFLTHYTNPCSLGYNTWMAASLLTANGKDP